jgi:hypothetical protein
MNIYAISFDVLLLMITYIFSQKARYKDYGISCHDELQVDIVTMLDEAYNYVKFLESQVEVSFDSFCVHITLVEIFLFYIAHYKYTTSANLFRIYIHNQV